MEIAYFKRHQGQGIYNYYKVYGGKGKTQNGYQEIINFLNEKPLIVIEHNFPYDPENPNKPFELTGTWDTYEVGIPISKEEYEQAYKKATESNFDVI